jgi:hypothetical protein
MKCPLCDAPNAHLRGYVSGRDLQEIACKCCGTFLLDPLASSEICQSYGDSRYLLCAAARAASDSGKPIAIMQGKIDRVAALAPRQGTLGDMVDRVLLLLADRASDYWQHVTPTSEVDFPLVAAKSAKQFSYLIGQLSTRNYWSEFNRTITAEGWHRVEQLRASQPTSNQAFVAMWFDPSLDNAWIDGFQPGIEARGDFIAVRVDRIQHNEKIDDRIVAEIRRSGLLVADFTGQRPGVYFEAGLATGLGIPVIWTCRADYLDSVHFDTRQYNHLVWRTPAELSEALSIRIAATVADRSRARVT